VRTYYTDIPVALQVGEHQFIERDVVDMFINLMLISWYSLVPCDTPRVNKFKCGSQDICHKWGKDIQCFPQQAGAPAPALGILVPASH
jgi:hypothetical protein